MPGKREPLGLRRAREAAREFAQLVGGDHGAVDLGEIATRGGREQPRQRAHRAARRDRGSRRVSGSRLAVVRELLAHTRAHGAFLVAAHRVRAHEFGVEPRGAERQRGLEAHLAIVAGDQLEEPPPRSRPSASARADLQLAAEGGEGEARLFGAREDARRDAERRADLRGHLGAVGRVAQRRRRDRDQESAWALRALSPSSRAVSTARAHTSSGTRPSSCDRGAEPQHHALAQHAAHVAVGARVGHQHVERGGAEIEDAEADRRLRGVVGARRAADPAAGSAAWSARAPRPSIVQTEPFSKRGSASIASPSPRSASRTAPIASPWRAERRRAIAEAGERFEEFGLVAAFGESLVDLDRQAERVRERRERLRQRNAGLDTMRSTPARRERHRRASAPARGPNRRAAAAAADRSIACASPRGRVGRGAASCRRRSEEGSGCGSRTRGGSVRIKDRVRTASGPRLLSAPRPARARSRLCFAPWKLRAMSWKPEVDEIERRRAAAAQQGGADAVAKQHARGRATVRERIAALVDADSFREHGDVAGVVETDASGRETGFTPANVVVGTARIDGRLVVVGGDDFTIRGGSYSPAGLRKGIYADELAVRRRVPVVRLLEGGGASITGATAVRGRSGYDWTASSPLNLLCMEALANVPVVCAALGPVAGFPAARLVASHFSLMTRQTAQVLTGGPALVERATGQRAHQGGARRRGRARAQRRRGQRRGGRGRRVPPDPRLPLLPAAQRRIAAAHPIDGRPARARRRRSCSRRSRASGAAPTRSAA